MTSIGDRTRLLGQVLGWWWAPSAGRLREITRQLDQARAEVTDPFETLNDDLARLWPASASLHDPRWHLLSHSGVQENTNSLTKAHWRCALIMAWLENAPDPASRAWGQAMLMARTDLSGYDRPMTGHDPIHEEAALRAALRCALSFDGARRDTPARPEGSGFNRWALGLAMAMGWQDEIQACAPRSGAWQLPEVQALLWVVCFDREDVLARMIQNGQRLNDEVSIPSSLIKHASKIAEEWAGRLGPAKDKDENKTKTLVFPSRWAWRNFGIAYWVASAGANRCLDVMLPRGIVLDEASKVGITAPVLCMQMLHPAMAAGMIENGAQVLIDIQKDEPNRALVAACMALEKSTELREDYLRAVEAMRVSHSINPWKREEVVWTLIAALKEAPAPALLSTLVQMIPNWHGFTCGGVPVMDKAIMASREHPGAGVLEALTGHGPGLMDDTVQNMPWGMLVAAVEPTALGAWLAHASAMEKQQLAGLVAASSIVVREVSGKEDKEGDILARLVNKDERIAQVVLRSGDPAAGLGAIMKDSVLGAAVRMNTPLIGKLWALAMRQSDKGKHEALEAALDYLPAPVWLRDDVVPAWGQLLSKPRNEGLVERVIKTCPVQVEVDDAGNTPLHMAMATNDANAAQWLAEAGADPDDPNDKGVTARSMASEQMLAAIARGQAGAMKAQVNPASQAQATPINRF